MIQKIDDKEQKEKICREILEALPEWFEIPESRVSYAKESRELPFWADVENHTVREGLYPEYDVTNAFYQKVGFRELECMEGLWDEANPCQVYVMAV